MKLAHGTRNPKSMHYPCANKECTNLFNSSYKNSNGYCSLCNRNRKLRCCELCDDGDGIFQDSGIRVCNECLIKYQIKEKQ